jgi:hypothetical protein
VRTLAALAAAAVATTSPARAQQHAALGVVDGIVTDTTLSPIANADVAILGSSLRIATGANGRFRIVALTPGRYILAIHRVGYAPISSALQVGGDDTLRLSFAMERATRTLDTVSVSTSRLVSRLAEFEQRRRLGQGDFMSQDEIDKRNFVATADLLQTFARVAIGTTAVNRRWLPAYSCPYQFFVDGVQVHYPTNVDTELPSPKDLAGIEVYANTAFVPLQYRTPGGGGLCGVILLWTRAGS